MTTRRCCREMSGERQVHRLPVLHPSGVGKIKEARRLRWFFRGDRSRWQPTQEKYTYVLYDCRCLRVRSSQRPATAMGRRGTAVVPMATTGLPRSTRPATLGTCTSTVVESTRRTTTVGSAVLQSGRCRAKSFPPPKRGTPTSRAPARPKECPSHWGLFKS